MFQSLASYFLGSTPTNDTENTLSSDQQNQTTPNIQNSNNIIAKPCVNNSDEEDISDWLLVDTEDNSPTQTDSEEEIPFVEIKNAPVLYKRGRHSRSNSNGAGSHDGLLSLSPASILPNSMDESWFVTPPPCFTSTGPIIMEMSPFENLLIEHPSMSVYHSMRRSIAGDDADYADIEDIYVVHIEREPVRPHPVAERSSSHTVRVRDRPTGPYRSLKQLMVTSNSQKGNGHKHTQSMCRNALERSNKVREVNSKGGRQKRSDMNHCKVISRANNNRKC